MAAIRSLMSPLEIWRKYDDMEQRLTAPVSERMLELAGLRPGMQVLDLATGRGEPAIRAARGVATSGRVLGVDTSDEMLRLARERAERENISNLNLIVTSAERLECVPASCFDVTLARWCLMYFDSPIVALEAARRAMVPAGRLVAAVWAEPERVPYFTLPRQVLSKFVPVPPIDPKLPGTFRYADLLHLHDDFAKAQFTVDHVEDLLVTVMEATTDDELISWVRAFGLTRMMKVLPESVQLAWEEELIKEAKPFRVDGRYRLNGVTRIVVASAIR